MQQEDITIVNVYESKNRAPKYMQQKLSELRSRQINTYTEDFNISS